MERQLQINRDVLNQRSFHLAEFNWSVLLLYLSQIVTTNVGTV